MPVEEIEFIIKPNGEVEMQPRGIKGPDCEKVTEPWRRKLGEATVHERTAEFFEQAHTETQEQREGVTRWKL
jgi:hypothetical protein